MVISMADPIRVLHFADIHIGMENYGRTDPETGMSTRLRDFVRRLDEMIVFARNGDVDLTIFAGDAFKSRTPNPTYQREFAHRIRELAELAPVVLLVGNHDLAPAVSRASSVEIYSTLNVPNVIVADEYRLYPIETKRGTVIVGAAPYPVRSRLLADIDAPGKTIRETDDAIRAQLLYVLEELAEEADALALERGDPGIPRILTGHFTVSGASFGSERGIMLGRDIEVPPSALADARWDYVALGHIHKHQAFRLTEDAPPIVYSGSMERIDFGEEGDPKGFCWVELERGAAAWSFHPVNAREFVTLRADLRHSEDPTQELVTLIGRLHLRDAVVRIIVQLTVETEAHLNENIVRDALRDAGVHIAAPMRKDIEQETRARLGSNPEGMSDNQLLEHYLISRQTPEPRRAALLERAALVFEAEAARTLSAPEE